MTQTAWVLGANGRIGRATALAFAQAGWQVHAQVRRQWTGALPAGVRVSVVDVNDTAAMVERSGPAAIVVHALNPPYTAWERELQPLADAAIALAQALGATLMLPGNVYPFGQPIPPVLSESTPFVASHPKARQRIEIEARLAAAPVRTIVLRAGDFFGGRGRGSFLDLMIAKDLARGRIVYPGPRTEPHAWAYLPDLAATFVAVAECRARLPAHATLHFPGHAPTGEEFVATLGEAARQLGIVQAAPQVRGFPWPLVRAAGVVVAMLRELARMSYLWREPHTLVSERLEALIGTVPHTPLIDALRAALLDLGADTRAGAG